jgi:hypothetical protein
MTAARERAEIDRADYTTGEDDTAQRFARCSSSDGVVATAWWRRRGGDGVVATALGWRA